VSRRKKGSLAARQRKRLEKLRRKQQQDSSEHGEGSSKQGEGSSKRRKVTPSKQGEGSSKRDKSPQTPPQSNPYADDEADEEEEGRRSPVAHCFGSGKPRGRISAELTKSTTKRARFKDGQLIEHGVILYDDLGNIRSRSPSPQTERQKKIAENKRKPQEDEPSPEY